MNDLLTMFLVSDARNFGDIILDEINSVRCNVKKTSEFTGNVFHLAIAQDNCILSNTLDDSMLDETYRTSHLYALIETTISDI